MRILLQSLITKFYMTCSGISSPFVMFIFDLNLFLPSVVSIPWFFVSSENSSSVYTNGVIILIVLLEKDCVLRLILRSSHYQFVLFLFYHESDVAVFFCIVNWKVTSSELGIDIQFFCLVDLRIDRWLYSNEFVL